MIRAVRARAIRPLAAFVGAAVLVLAPWYLRILFYTGNPVFPFYASIFGSSEWVSLHDSTLLAAGTGPEPLSIWTVIERQASRIFHGVGFLLRVPWAAVFERGVFNSQAPLSPFYIVLIPLCAPLALFAKRQRRLVLLVAAYGLFWLTTVRDLRFLVAVAPVLNIALFASVDKWTGGSAVARRRELGLVMAAVLLAPGVFYCGHKIHQRGLVPVTAEQRSAYLVKAVSGYEPIHGLNRIEGTSYTVYALYGENLRYYADGRFLGDWFGPARFSRVKSVLGDGQALYEELRGLGACYFLIRHRQWRSLVPRDPFFRQHFEPRSQSPDYVLYRLRGVACSRTDVEVSGNPSPSGQGM